MGDIGTPLEDLLRGAAERGDKLADDAVDAFVRDVRPDDLLDYLQNIIRLPTRTHLGHDLTMLGESGTARSAFDEFLENMSRSPPWIRPEEVEIGADFIRQRVSAAALSLGTASLPTCYCWEPEAGVLMYTQRLALETPRRILETAQFLLDVMTPTGLSLSRRPYARGVRAAQKIRLMHAVVRFIIRNRAKLLQDAYARYRVSSEADLEVKAKENRNPWIGFLLQPSTGLAINQEQLAGTILTFSIVILQSFKRIHMRVSREEEQAYLHAWKVVGYLLGVDEDLLKLTENYQSAEALRVAIMRRHRRPSANAQQLASALSAYLAEDIELLLGLQKWLPAQRIPRLTMWMLLERPTLAACAVVLERKDRWLYPPVRFVAIVLGLLHNIPLVRALSTLLFDYLCKKVWAWRSVPLGSDRPASWLRTLFGLKKPSQPVAPVLRNWADTARTEPARVEQPSAAAAIVQILRDPVTYPSPVRVMGSYHSTTPCADADGGTIIRLDKLRRVLEIGTNFVDAEAGALYIDVAHELYRRGLEFYVNLQIGNITMGAAACSTTKDGAFPDDESAQASYYCSAMTIVRPDGAVERIDERSAPAEMAAARSSHGLLGVVCAVRFKVRPIQYISIEHRNMSVEEFLRRLPELKAHNCSLEYYLYPFIDRVSVKIRRKSTADGEVNRWVWKLRNFTISRVVPVAARVIGCIPTRILRDMASALFYRVASFSLQWLCNAEKTYASDQMTRYRRPPGKYAFTFSIWAFPEHRFPQVLRAYIDFLKRHYAQTGYRSHMPTVGYLVSQDRTAPLSYTWSGPVITIDPTAIGGADWNRFVDAFNDFCSKNEGTPLLNQTPGLNADHMRAFGKRLQDFKALRRSIDPGNRFLSPYFEELLRD